jgi:biopolymer transport protein ExbD
MGMSTGGSGKHDSKTNSEINVTPLVDVCLVLLIIFMVTVPRALPEISVRVPPEPAPETPHQSEDTLVMRVDEHGGIRLDDEPVNRRELERRLSAALANRDRRAVFLDCHPDADFGAAVAALDVAKRAGALVLGVVKPRDEPVPERLEPR